MSICQFFANTFPTLVLTDLSLFAACLNRACLVYVNDIYTLAQTQL